MQEKQLMSFTNENGEKIEYIILEQRLICGKEYVAMAPVNNKNNVEVYKINFDKDWNENLCQVDSQKEIDMFKQVSEIKF